jgi:glucosylceramidase
VVDPGKAFQTVEGFGGALTDAAAETFARLPEEKPPGWRRRRGGV